MEKEDKQYATQSAIYRMWRKKLINGDDVQTLLRTRAGHSERMAKRLKELWGTSYPIRQAWGL